MASKTILIVDDDLPFAQFLDDMLTAAGYATIIAKHGAAAFLELEIVHADLILMDVFMPVIDGITLCRLVRANPTTRTTPILVMSAMSNVEHTIPVPIDGFLPKPLDIDVLLQLVATLVAVSPLNERTV